MKSEDYENVIYELEDHYSALHKIRVRCLAKARGSDGNIFVVLNDLKDCISSLFGVIKEIEKIKENVKEKEQG